MPPKLSFRFVKQSFENEDCILLSTEYIGCHYKLNYICPNGHEHSITWYSWKRGVRCAKCSNMVSKPEIEVQEYVRLLGIDFIENDRTTILNQETGRYLELDLWFPELNKAIEFNGTYWHNNEKTIKRDQYKKGYCEWKGIDLFIIEEQDWYGERKRCEEIIKRFIYGN